MFTLEYAKNPSYSDITGESISLVVKFVEFDSEMPFGATSFDPMPHGVELFNRAKNGEFGEVAPFVDPMVATQPQPQTSGSQNL